MKTRPFLACLLLALSTLRGENTLPIKTEFGAKSPVPAGAGVSLKLPEKARLGDALPGAFTVTNTGDEPFEISTGGDYRGTGFPLRLKIRVTDSQGKVLPDESANQPDFGGMSGTRKIEPGASYDISFPLPGYVSFPGPGTYTVEACHDLGWLVEEEHPHPVAKTNIEIIMPTEEEIVARVRDLCSGGEDWERRFQLEKLGNGIFLPALIQEAKAGHANAVTGIAGIHGAAAFEALIDLLEGPSADVAKASGAALKWRLPSLGDPTRPAFPSWGNKDAGFQEWNPKFRERLLNAALTMLRSKDAATVELGAALIQAQGDAAQAKALLDATQAALDSPWEIRSGKGANTLDPPPPLRGLIQAIDALRGRGWRLGDTDGGSAVILARFRELADPNSPRPATERWKQTVLAFADANPPTFRQNAILAMPTPLPAEFEPALMKALEDKDWGVLRSACEVAGRSGRAAFVQPLCQIVEATHETFVQSAASSAAQALGARVELWESWCEVISDQDFMSEALRQLALGTLDITSGSSSGNSNFTREQRFAIRDAWREFIRKNHDRLARGERVPTGDPSVSNSLTGSDFNASDPAVRFLLSDGKSWPPAPVAREASH